MTGVEKSFLRKISEIFQLANRRASKAKNFKSQGSKEGVASVFGIVFLISFFVFWKILSDYAPLEQFAGVDVRIVNAMASSVAAAGVAFTIYVVSKAFWKKEEKKTDYGEKPKPKQPKFSEVYSWDEEE